MEKKSCCCRLFSCFACFSDENTTPSTAVPNAANEALTHPYHDSQPPVAPPAASSSEATTSTDVRSDLSSSSQLIVPSDLSVSSQLVVPSDLSVSSQLVVPSAAPSSSSQLIVPSAAPSSSSKLIVPSASLSSSSSQPIVPSAAPLSSSPSQPNTSPSSSNAATNNQLQETASSSSGSKADLDGHIQNIRTCANALHTLNVDADLDGLIESVSQFLEVIKEERSTGNESSKTKLPAKNFWQSPSESLKKFKEVLSEGINVFKDIIPGEAKTAVQGLLKGMGTAHLATTGLLIVALVLERFETVSTNRKQCLCVLDEICKLAQHVKKLQQRPQLKEGMEDSMKEAMGLIVEAAMMCSAQIGSPKGRSFWSASGDKEELVDFQQKLQIINMHMEREMRICLYDASDCRQMRSQKPRERQYPDYAVGIEEQLKEVTKLLEWESENNAVAVILHGFGGMGKTTLADAVFARLYIEGCKYSMVKLFDDINSTPSTSDILKLQTYILKDLQMGTLGEDIRTVEEGQREIGSILQREKAFIYVDNVLLRYPLEQLLPRDMVNAKKLRLLITTRDIDACSECTKMITHFYDVKGIPHDDAKSLLKTGMKSQTDDMEEQLNSSQLDRIAEICGGIPKLLEVVAGFIRGQKDKQKAYNKVIQEKEENWKGKIGEGITHYVFAYQNLPEKLKDPFLEICAFFNGWDWDTVANIVGDDELEMLEQRALVKKDPRGRLTVRVHDVILAMGRQQTQGTRFTITNQSQIQNLEDEDVEKIKGIRLLSGKKGPMSISASIIDLMCSSLRVLELGDSIKVEGKCEKTFKKLIYFVDEGFHLRFNVSKSKELKIFIGAAENFNLFQMPSSLVHVELNGECLNSHPFQISSQCLGQLRNLRVLTLTSFSQLTQLPQNLVDVAERLQYLRLESCEHLEELPEFDSKLRCLKELEISSCNSFRKLPEDVGSLNSLQKLTLSDCVSLEVLPSSLDKLSSLQELHVRKCGRLEVLPNGLDKLLSLKVLDLSWCENLKNLTFDLGKLTSLVQLRLRGCEKLSSIPQSISQLKLLDSTMDLSSSLNLKELPDGFCNLSFLTNLQLGWCRSLEKLPDRFGELSNLVKLSLQYCESLKELPESFGRLKTLEHLDLSRCSTLEELCRDFKGLLSLRVLSLDYCSMLKTLPEDFHCLTSLEILGLRDCSMLEGKWMESVVKMKTLQMIVNIEGSPMLEERWGEIQRQGDQSVHPIRDNFAVHTRQGLANDESKENVLKSLQAEFDSILTNGRGEPFHTSDIPLNTLLLVMFDGQEEFHDCYALTLIEENIDDIESNVNMIYFGNHFNKLPKKVADRILGHAPANSNVQPLFQKVLATVGRGEDVVFRGQFEMSMKIASDQKGDKYFSSWKRLTWYLLEEFVIEKCGRYQRLKKLAEGSAESNTELLRELFATGEGEDIHCCFAKNDGSDKVGVDELKGKTILLEIRSVNLGYELPLQALTEMYVAEKERLNFEIITIPVNGRYEKWDALDKFSSDIPWLVLQSPWQLTDVTKYFLVEGCARWPQEWDESDDEWDEWYPNIMRVIDGNGRIAAHNSVAVLRMVNTWGAEAYPFTEEKSKELKEKEMNQMKTMSDLMFIFKHLEEVEATHQPKMICLCTSDDIEFISSIRNALIEWSDSFVIIYIPKFGKKDGQDISFTDGIDGYFRILKRLEMVQIEMEGMTLLNLSEYKAMRFWARIISLKEVMERIEDSQKQFSRMKNLLSSIDSRRLRNSEYSWMVIMDEDGNLLTTKGTEIVKVLSKENPDDKAKQLMQQLFKGAKESRKETLVELEQVLS